MALDLDRKHPHYKELEPERITARDLYTGSRAVKAAREKYLYKTANESGDQYNLRLKRAVYDNWAEVVIKTRQALLWRKAPSRTGFGTLEQYLQDVDGCGNSADTFFRQVGDEAAVDGLRWVLVDRPPNPAGVISQAQEAALNLRPRMRQIAAQDVFDWDYDDYGRLRWAVIAICRVARPGPGIETIVRHQRLVWEIHEWRLYERANDGRGDWTQVARAANPLAVVPLVAFYGIHAGHYQGLPVTKDVHGHCLSIYNKFSDRDCSEFLTNNPIPLFISPAKPEAIQVGSGNGIWLSSAGAGDRVSGQYLEPSGKGAESSRNSERDLIRRIGEIALRQAKRDTAQVQSDDSLHAEAEVYNSSLVSITSLNQRGESSCWDLFARFMGARFTGKVENSTDFDDSVIDPAMVTAFSGAVDKHQLSRSTFLRIMKDGDALPEDVEVEEELRRIDDDMNSLAMPGLSGSTNPADGGVKPGGDTNV